MMMAEKRIEAMRSALEAAAAQFRRYADHHTEKGASDKAETNRHFAELCEQTARSDGWVGVNSDHPDEQEMHEWLTATASLFKNVFSGAAAVRFQVSGDRWDTDVRWTGAASSMMSSRSPAQVSRPATAEDQKS